VIRLLRTMCEGECQSVPRIGDKETVEAVTAESLYAHFVKTLASSQVELLYMGAKSPEEVETTLRTMLEGLPRAEITPFGTEVIRSAAAVREISERMDVTQGKLSMGFRTGCTCAETEYPALLLLNAVFGGCVTSKLFRNVRERMSLCYYASSSLEKHKGLMVVSSGIEFKNYEVTKSEILRQLDDCRSGNISDDELEQARAYLLSSLKIAKDRPGSVDEFYLGQAILGLEGTMEQQMELLQAVTKDEVIAAANRISLDTIYFLKGVEA